MILEEEMMLRELDLYFYAYDTQRREAMRKHIAVRISPLENRGTDRAQSGAIAISGNGQTAQYVLVVFNSKSDSTFRTLESQLPQHGPYMPYLEIRSILRGQTIKRPGLAELED